MRKNVPTDNWIFTCKKMKLVPHLASLTKINSKGIENLTVGPETIKLLEENTGKQPFDTGLGNDFFGYDN